MEISFGEYVAPDKVNPYTETVAQLITASESNPNASVTLAVDVNDAPKEQFKFQRAANEAGKTAKVRLVDDSAVKEGKPDEDGNPTHKGIVKITFTLTTKHKARRGAKPDAEVSAE